MGNSKGRDNVKNRTDRHKKTERLAAAAPTKEGSKQGAKPPSAGGGAAVVG